MSQISIANMNGGVFIADGRAIAEIEAELARDQASLDQAGRHRACLANDVRRGINVVSKGIDLRIEMQTLADNIFRNKILLVNVRRSSPRQST